MGEKDGQEGDSGGRGGRKMRWGGGKWRRRMKRWRRIDKEVGKRKRTVKEKVEDEEAEKAGKDGGLGR